MEIKLQSRRQCLLHGRQYRKLRCLAVFFGFEGGIFRSPCKKVFERGLLILHALLQWNTRNIVQKSKRRQLLDFDETKAKSFFCFQENAFLTIQ